MPTLSPPALQSDTEPLSNDSSADSPPPESSFEEFNKLLKEFQLISSRLYSSATELVRAQLRLTTYVIYASVQLYAFRLVICLFVVLLVLGGWWFLNSTVWQAVHSLTSIPFLPPLALFALNSLTAAGLYAWQAKLR
jgi:hypothetical protein